MCVILFVPYEFKVAPARCGIPDVRAVGNRTDVENVDIPSEELNLDITEPIPSHGLLAARLEQFLFPLVELNSGG